MKKAIPALLAVFVLFWLFTDPKGLADVASRGGSAGLSFASDMGTAVIDFVDELA
ncbi:hypothetical protein [Nocardioides acrostichi]|uniref:hypothetical protein n=1 Tax=Nocardioides acrostichi TaxID=2784339 RepID=UPI001F433F01|nr:hypothetical protein [Nocardioides acrostichi]